MAIQLAHIWGAKVWLSDFDIYIFITDSNKLIWLNYKIGNISGKNIVFLW